MIKTFKHRGLKTFFLTGDSSKLIQSHIKKLRLLLANLNASIKIENMNLPGLNLHKLQGDRANLWAIAVNGNWRLTFAFENGDAYDVDYLDYH